MFAVYGGRTQANAKAKFREPVKAVDTVQIREERRRRAEEEQAEHEAAMAKHIAEVRAKQKADMDAARCAARQFHVSNPSMLDFTKGRKPVSTYNRIEGRICKALGLSPADVRSKNRNAKLVFARQAITYWCHRQTLNSAPAIGVLMGGYDHTTLVHGRRKYREKRASQGRYLREVV